MDQRKEEEDSLLKELTDQRSEEEEPADQRKAAAAADEAEEEERSSDEESVSASTLFVHPCSLLQYLVRAFACCLGMQPPDYFAGTATKPSATVAPTSLDSSRGGETPDRDRRAGGATGFYVQEVITRVWALRRGPRPPGKPREGSGGNGGHHH